MDNKKLVGKLVDFYWELETMRDSLIDNGNVDSEDISLVNNAIVNMDTILTNVSKRWAKGKKGERHEHLWFYDVNKNARKGMLDTETHWEICGECQERRERDSDGAHCACSGLPIVV